MDRSRFDVMLPLDETRRRVTIVGCGGIGSYTGSILARMGFARFHLVDFDRVEETNVATQDFEASAVGLAKTTALAERIRGINPEAEVFTHAMALQATGLGPWTRAEWEKPGVVVAALDSIEARQAAWERTREGDIFIDPRMGAEALLVVAVMKGGEGSGGYEAILYNPESKPMEEPCGARAIAYTGAVAGALVARALRGMLVEGEKAAFFTGEVGLVSNAPGVIGVAKVGMGR